MHPETPFDFAPALPTLIDALPDDDARPLNRQFTRGRQAAFLRRLADCGEVRSAARSANVSHQSVYRMRRACEDFARGWDAALLIAREHAEEALATRAMHGTQEEVFYHGEVVATRRRFDTRLLLAHLARLDRLAEREDTATLAGAFDAVIDAFEDADERGGEMGGPVLPDGLGEGADIASGPCNRRSKSPDDSEAGGGAEAGEADGPTALDLRLDAMDAARPAGVPTPGKAANGYEEADALEAAQLAAFEAGAERWWEAGSVDDVEINAGMAARDHADLLGRGAGQVDLPPTGEGAAIVDAHGDAAPVAGVGDLDPRAEGQRLMSGGHGVHVEPLPIGSQAAMEPAAIVGGDARAEGADHRVFDRRNEDGQINSGRRDAQVGAGAVERGEFVEQGRGVLR